MYLYMYVVRGRLKIGLLHLGKRSSWSCLIILMKGQFSREREEVNTEWRKLAWVWGDQIFLNRSPYCTT